MTLEELKKLEPSDGYTREEIDRDIEMIEFYEQVHFLDENGNEVNLSDDPKIREGMKKLKEQQEQEENDE